MLFALIATLFFLAVWKTKAPERLHFWRKTDAFLLIILAYGISLLCVYNVQHMQLDSSIFEYGFSSINTYDRINLFAWAFIGPVLMYLSVMGVSAEFLMRIRDRQLLSTLYWVHFFRLVPLKNPMGVLMTLCLAGSLWCLFITYPSSLLTIGWFDPLVFIIAIIVFAVLTYICTFILSLSAEYEKANAEKIRAERFKAELITNVSHDIRSPLTSIINYVDLLKALPVESEEFTEYVGVLNKKSARLKTLIDDLMEASKAGTGNISVDMQQTDLLEIVGQIAGEFDDQFTERDLFLVLRHPDQPVWVQADSRHLWRVLENLFSNAAKYTLPGTRVFAEVALRDGKPIFSLKNTSQNPMDLSGEELAEQFIRGDRARQTEGSGLGLYIAKSLMELMGGHLTITVTADLFEAEVSFI
jgi:signal transduction histidine kinase